MNSFRFSPEAEQDLNDVYDYLAQHSQRAAARTIDAIERRCRGLVQFPGMGAERDDLQPGLRVVPSGSYVIFYRITDPDVEIVRIVHGSRDFKSLFNP
jgi:toxin ParE1/3/4